MRVGIALHILVLLAVRPAVAEWSESAFCIPDASVSWTLAEGNKAIMLAKLANPMSGAMVYAHVRNASARPVGLEAASWNGVGAEQLRAAHLVVWWRLQPREIPAGGVGEVALRLRRPPKGAGDLDVRLTDGTARSFHVDSLPPPFRIQSLGYADGLRKVFLYVERMGKRAPLPQSVALDGRIVRARWLSRRYVGSLLIAVVEMPEPLLEGAYHTWSVGGGDEPWVSSTVRVVTGTARFGTYGFSSLRRFAVNGLTSYASFRSLDKHGLDTAAGYGMRVAMHVSGGQPPQETVGHPGIMGYLLKDEPDCGDYSADTSLPMHLRLGTLAPQMVREAQTGAEIDKVRPIMITLDLTFTPGNYFTYGPIPDLINADCYPVTIGWRLDAVRKAAQTLKRASAPRPCVFTIQGCWEEYARQQGRWVGPAEIRSKGFEAFADPERKRGFGRAPWPEEIRIQMLYALGSGARGLLSYTDATECGGSLLFHGTEDLPENWDAIGRMARRLDSVAPLIDVSHAADIATAECERAKLWVRTLVCGENAALVLAVNENYRCDAEGFALKTARDVKFIMPDLPWFIPRAVHAVSDDGFAKCASTREKTATSWTVGELADVAVFLLSEDDALVSTLEERRRSRDTELARALLAVDREDVRRAGEQRLRDRLLEAAPAESQLVGEPIHGYGETDKHIWNPRGEKHNCLAHWERKGTAAMGFRWAVKVSAASAGGEGGAAAVAGKPYRFVWKGHMYGPAPIVLTVADAEGRVVQREEYPSTRPGAVRVHEHRVQFPEAGQYSITLTLTPPEPAEHGGRAGRVAFLLAWPVSGSM